MAKGKSVATRGALPVEASTEAGQLLQLAMTKDLDVDVLERLIALKERQEDRSARQAFFAALAAFQAEVGPLRKSKRVAFESRKGGKVDYGYAPLDEIERVCRPLLLSHGLAYTWDTELTGTQVKVDFRLTHVDGHSETSSWSCLVEKQAKMNQAQSTASTTTYGKRQSMVAGLGLSNSEDDVDGQIPGEPETVIDMDTLIKLKNRVDAVIGQNRGAFDTWVLEAFGAELLGELTEGQAQEVLASLDRKEEALRRKAAKEDGS